MGLPVPGIAAHILKVVFGFPAEELSTLVRAGIYSGEVACATRCNLIGDGDPVNPLKGLDHVQYTVTHTGAEIKDILTTMGLHVIDGGNVTARKVNNMDVVAHTGAVRGVVVVAENIQVIPAADSHLGDEGHEIVGNAAWVFTDLAALVSPDGIEIAQKHNRPIFNSLGGIAQDLLGHVLGPAIGIGAHAGAGCLLQGHVIVPGIDRRGGGEDDVLDAMVPHSLTETDGGEKIVVIVFQRHLDGFTHGLQSGKVDGTVDVVLFKNAVQSGAIADILLIEGDGFAGDLFDTLYGLGRGVDEVINDDDVDILLKKLYAGVAADISGAAGNKYSHGNIIPFFYVPDYGWATFYLIIRQAAG